MSIVLNEKEWAENAISARSLGKRPVETLGRVARYYYQSEKYKKDDVRNKLEDFLLQCDPSVVLVKWENTIDKLVRSAGKLPLIELDGVDITDAEIEAVQKLNGKQSQRLAFTLLCVAKYWNAIQPQNNNWVNTADKEIMNMANVHTTISRQSLMLHELRNLGLIKFSKRVDSLNIQVKFINDDSKTALHISDFRNLGNQYMLYCGDRYFQCENCGLTIKRNHNMHRYCPDCATEIHIKKTVESVMRGRTARSLLS